MDGVDDLEPRRRSLTPVLVVVLVAPVLVLGSFFAGATARSERQLAEVTRERRVELSGADGDQEVVDALIVAEISGLERAHTYDLASVAMLIVAGAISIAGLLVAEHRRRMGARMVSSATDPLTGLGDADLLARRGAALLADRRYTHHGVVVVSIPDLSTVAEVYGVGQADRVQVDLARRLRSGVDWLIGARPDATSTIARVGDGEFVVVLHARETVDPVSVDSVLSLHSGRVIRFGRDRIPVRHAVGIHVAAYGDDLVDSIEQARGRTGRGRTEHVEPIPPLVAPLSFTR